MDACYPLMQMVAQTTRDWDGSEAIRELNG